MRVEQGANTLRLVNANAAITWSGAWHGNHLQMVSTIYHCARVSKVALVSDIWLRAAFAVSASCCQPGLQTGALLTRNKLCRIDFQQVP